VTGPQVRWTSERGSAALAEWNPYARRTISLTLLFSASAGVRSDPSSARGGADLSDVPRLRVTHPFHPLAGGEFEFVKRRRNWQADRVYFLDGGGEMVVLPAEWTDVVAADPFVVLAAGRSAFDVAGLLELSELVARLTVERPEGSRRRVKRTMP
jgi:hypothetical protein